MAAVGDVPSGPRIVRSPHCDGPKAGRQYDFALLSLDAPISGQPRIVRLAAAGLASSADAGRALVAVG